MLAEYSLWWSVVRCWCFIGKTEGFNAYWVAVNASWFIVLGHHCCILFMNNPSLVRFEAEVCKSSFRPAMVYWVSDSGNLDHWTRSSMFFLCVFEVWIPKLQWSTLTWFSVNTQSKYHSLPSFSSVFETSQDSQIHNSCLKSFPVESCLIWSEMEFQ